MAIVNPKYQRPERLEGIARYDYTICRDDIELQRVIRELNEWRLTLISVTQDPNGIYRVFYSTACR